MILDLLGAQLRLRAEPGQDHRRVRDLGIAVSVVSLPDDLRQRLQEAQRRQ
jgi:hypothetical protein